LSIALLADSSIKLKRLFWVSVDPVPGSSSNLSSPLSCSSGFANSGCSGSECFGCSDCSGFGVEFSTGCSGSGCLGSASLGDSTCLGSLGSLGCFFLSSCNTVPDSALSETSSLWFVTIC